MCSAGGVQRAIVLLAVLGICLPQPVLAAGIPAGPMPRVADVALSDGGKLIGQVVDPQGAPRAEVTVSVLRDARPVAMAATDANGYFSVVGLRGGVYHVATPDLQATVRLWTPGSAPPASQAGVLLVSGGETVRGQLPGFGALKFWLSNPWVLTGAAAAAVAVPIAIHNSQRPSSP